MSEIAKIGDGPTGRGRACSLASGAKIDADGSNGQNGNAHLTKG